MAWWRKQADDSGFPKVDSGSGSLDDYAFDLIPRNNRVTMRLAGSDPYQADLATLIGETELTTAGGQRSLEDERTDAPTLIRLFTGTKVTGVVGTVPRGLEAVVSETLSRLEQAGKKPRIPVKIVQTRHGIRVELLMGQTR